MSLSLSCAKRTRMKPSCRRAGSSLILAGAFAFCFWLALVAPVEAHARLLRSEPAKGGLVTVAPGQIQLWFNELLDEGFNAVEVFAAAAKPRVNLATGKPVVDRQDRTLLKVPLPSLPPGEYIVEWRVLSRDGHSAPGRLAFRVGTR